MSTAVDPIHALIERHREAQVLAGRSDTGASDEEFQPFFEAEDELWGDLLNTPPITLDGAIAFAHYIPVARLPSLPMSDDDGERAMRALLAGLYVIKAREGIR